MNKKGHEKTNTERFLQTNSICADPKTIFPITVPNAAAVIKLETTPVSKPSAKYVGSSRP